MVRKRLITRRAFESVYDVVKLVAAQKQWWIPLKLDRNLSKFFDRFST